MDEAIIALPLNIFYNTGIATYIWVLANKKAAHRKGKVQLIDASQWFQPMRRNLGKKNCELAEADIDRILKHYLDQPPADADGAKAVPECKWFDNADFGYWKITVERPLRLKSQLKRNAIESLRFATGDEALRSEMYAKHGDKLYTEFAKLKPEMEAWLKGDDGDEDADDDSDDEDAKTTKKTETKDLDEAIIRAEDEIKLIREYRDRQIADVVMGQVDVRGWVPGPDDVVAEEDLAALGGDEEIDTDGEEDDGDD